MMKDIRTGYFNIAERKTEGFLFRIDIQFNKLSTFENRRWKCVNDLKKFVHMYTRICLTWTKDDHAFCHESETVHVILINNEEPMFTQFNENAMINNGL